MILQLFAEVLCQSIEPEYATACCPVFAGVDFGGLVTAIDVTT